MTDSPFHLMVEQWGNAPDFAEAYDQTDPSSRRLCLSYRGKYYQKEIERLVQRYRYRKPDIIFFDVEIFDGAEEHVQHCKRCRTQMVESGKKPIEYATDRYAETAREIAAALNKAADEMGRPHPPIGYYHLSPNYAYHGVFDFAKMYPQGTQFLYPEVYVRCWPPAAAEIIRQDKRKAPPGCPIIPVISPGTLNMDGETTPARFFDALMECFFNGATGAYYYTPWNLTPGHLLAQAQVVQILKPIEDLFAKSTLFDDVTCDQKNVHLSALRSGDEYLLLVGEFKHLGDVSIKVHVPVKQSLDVIDLFTGKRIATLTSNNNQFTVRISGAYRTRPFYIGDFWLRRVRQRSE